MAMDVFIQRPMTRRASFMLRNVGLLPMGAICGLRGKRAALVKGCYQAI